MAAAWCFIALPPITGATFAAVFAVLSVVTLLTRALPLVEAPIPQETRRTPTVRVSTEVQRRHERATHWAEFVSGLGIVALVAGAVTLIAATLGNLNTVALLLILGGPILVYVSLVGAFTFFEDLEPDQYGRKGEQD